jgi:zinc transport system substrate-binding protein
MAMKGMAGDMMRLNAIAATIPHVWLSPRQAVKLAENIKDGLTAADPAGRERYAEGFRALKERLEELDRQFAETIAAAPKKEIIVSHNAFAYIARDYGLNLMSVMGLSPDEEPTAQRMKEIADFAKERGIRHILFEELVSPRVAETLAESLGIGTMVLNPLEGLTEEQARNGEDYFSIMTANLTTLKKALQ